MYHRTTSSPDRPLAKGGFTLLEMLVGVALVGVLVAMLFPAFKNVFEKGKLTKCIGNQRAIINGLILYANENDGRLPEYADTSDSTTSMWWYLIGPYMPVASTPTRRLGAEFLTCPSANKTETIFSYGVNYGAWGLAPISYNAPTWGNGTFPGSKRLSQVSVKTFLVADQADVLAGSAIYSPLQWPFDVDSDNDSIKDSYGAFLPKFPYNHLALRHNGKAVAAFPDGSVRAMSGKEWADALVKKTGLWWDEGQ